MFVYTAVYDLVPTTMQELMVLPNISRELLSTFPTCRYRDNEIKYFGGIASRYDIRIETDSENVSQETLREKIRETLFKENCEEWVILDNPTLAVAKKDDCNSNDPFTPVVIMNVTQNGDNAYTVYLPLGECCCRGAKGYNSYYLGGFEWKVRPFENIMKLLQKGKKIGYISYEVLYKGDNFKDYYIKVDGGYIVEGSGGFIVF